jgi:hypothetical protein
VAGHNVIRREMAKEWLRNTVIMIVLIQASFYLYGLLIDLSSKISSSLLSMVDPHFFMLTSDNLVNVGLEFLFVLFYVLILFFTIVLLTIRYLVVCFGILHAPIGVFCYYIPPLRGYGKMILNMLGAMIFMTCLDALIILGCSMVAELELFSNYKILLMMCCFLIIDMLFFSIIKHILHKSALSESGDKAAEAIKYIVMFL